jgi:hypothetical protein
MPSQHFWAFSPSLPEQHFISFPSQHLPSAQRSARLSFFMQDFPSFSLQQESLPEQPSALSLAAPLCRMQDFPSLFSAEDIFSQQAHPDFASVAALWLVVADCAHDIIVRARRNAITLYFIVLSPLEVWSIVTVRSRHNSTSPLIRQEDSRKGSNAKNRTQSGGKSKLGVAVAGWAERGRLNL